jgi:lysophospholipase L1-like esterase
MKRKRKPCAFGLRRSVRSLAAGSLAFGALLAAHGQTSAPARRAPAVVHDARWQSSFDAFAAADVAQAPQAGGVVFVGSSSIRLWNDLETSFQTQPPIVKRGFGGSRLSDCSSHLQRLVLPYKPRLVVVYAGDNDLAEGATPQQVLQSFEAFVRGVRAELPETRIAFVSIKPSPLRENLMPAAHATNRLIEAYARGESNVDFVDVYTKMLGQDGRPRNELFGADKLHLNEAGYALWQRELAAQLKL